MAEPARALDDVSAQLAEMLRHADALLDDWMRFGAEVRARVEREAAGVGAVVAQAVDGASERALAMRLAAVSTELERLEQRIRAASRIAAEQRATDRRILAGIAAGVGIVIALLVVLVLRGPTPPQLAPPQPLPVVGPPVDAAPPPPPVDAAPPPPPPDAAPVKAPAAAPAKRR
ncbi:MAG: hypothetical protein ABJE66_17155 [Deltaproteobacteria bacterium]